ncbi:DUF4363 family protein [Ammoniphilus resinae]|uniref:DUF4363 family protein n=1 Tax=Ammoniphilus resinae TaxID=861532 RepID=A0ABS4GS99_9BACL|nr:DUF4363 family protein [Ammoniphilus resinae]MBP1933143.1 hypothetical protein [Ammoniphilus resinae]
MPRKWLVYALPIFILVVSVAVMTGGYFLKKPFGEDDRLVESIQQLEKDVREKKWDHAKEHAEYANKAWHKIVNRIQFSSERDYLIEINTSLARIRGGVEAKDDKGIMEEIYLFYDLWKYLGK